MKITTINKSLSFFSSPFGMFGKSAETFNQFLSMKVSPFVRQQFFTPSLFFSVFSASLRMIERAKARVCVELPLSSTEIDTMKSFAFRSGFSVLLVFFYREQGGWG